jgi:uncharacterized protein (DUF58 family)
MHLTGRSLWLIALAAALGIVGLWSNAAVLPGLWLVPIALLVTGLAFESARVSRLRLDLRLRSPSAVLLGQACEFHPGLTADQDVAIEWLLPTPQQLQAEVGVRALRLRAGIAATVSLRVLPVHLGDYAWPSAAARLRGALGLAHWSRDLPLDVRGRVLPDLRLRAPRRVPGRHRTAQARRAIGEGIELHQLRDYRAGDPLSRIAWRRSARHGRLLTREAGDERELDLLLVIDAGVRSAGAAGRLDRLGVHVNLALHLAAEAGRRGDRIGLLLHAGEVLAAIAPVPDPVATLRLRGALAAARPGAVDSDPAAAALRTRSLLSRRALIVWLADVDEALAAADLAAVAKILMPPHRVVFAGVDTQRSAALRRRRMPASSERDAWLVLAGDEQQRRVVHAVRRLRALGAPVVSAAPEALEDAVLAEYARQR